MALEVEPFALFILTWPLVAVFTEEFTFTTETFFAHVGESACGLVKGNRCR